MHTCCHILGKYHENPKISEVCVVPSKVLAGKCLLDWLIHAKSSINIRFLTVDSAFLIVQFLFNPFSGLPTVSMGWSLLCWSEGLAMSSKPFSIFASFLASSQRRAMRSAWKIQNPLRHKKCKPSRRKNVKQFWSAIFEYQSSMNSCELPHFKSLKRTNSQKQKCQFQAKRHGFEGPNPWLVAAWSRHLSD